MFALNRSGGIQLRAAGVAWDGGGDGSSWSDPLNWDNDAVPTAVDDVLIDSNATVNIGSGTTINSLTLGNGSGSTTPTLNFSYDAIGGSALIIDDGNLSVNQNANITHSAGGASPVGKISITVQTGSATINGTIDIDSKGYTLKEGPGAGATPSSGSGGSYGGEGAVGNLGAREANTATYGSITAPEHVGSGGGYNTGGSGGGAVKLQIAGNVDIDGVITADGGNAGTASGGGSGGSIYIVAGGTLTGTGSLTANGGNGGTTGGGGGGGRIALLYETNSSSISSQAYGGTGGTHAYRFGGAGTIYTKADAATNGNLVVDNNSKTNIDDRYFGRTTLVPATTTASLTYDTLTIRNHGNIELHGNLTLSSSTLVWNSNGTITDRGGTMSPISSAGTFTLPSGAILFADTARSFSSLTINGKLTHTSSDSTKNYAVNYTVTGGGDLTVNIGGSVDVAGKGHSSQTGAGAGGTISYGSGGTHGGEGGAAINAAVGSNSKTYGSITAPVTLGSGGGASSGGFGGGAVKIAVDGNVVINGTVTADGGAPSSGTGGGGAGGSVYIVGNANATPATLSGSGTVTANGSGVSNFAGGGGGGRIALYYVTNSSSITTQAYGGTGGTDAYRFGGAGTIYTKAASATNGDLVIDNNDKTDAFDAYFGRTTLTPDNTPGSFTYDNLTVQNYGNLELNDDTTVTVASTFTWSNEGVITDHGGVMAPFSTAGSLTIPATSTLYADTARSFTDVTVNGTLIHSNNGTTAQGQLYAIDLTITGGGDFTLNASGNINLDGKGYLQQQGPGAGATPSHGGGGSHGGEGGVARLSAARSNANTYGSVTSPITLGSGGGYSAGGRGGGAVKIAVDGNVTLSGVVSANASVAANAGGGGAGGSIFFTGNTNSTPATLSGSGTVSANGSAGKNNGGGGGGGRIAVYYVTNSSSLAFQAYGGSGGSDVYRYGGAGTIFTKSSGATYGNLVIDNNNKAEDIDYYFGRTTLTPSGTPASFTFGTLNIQNDGHLELNTETTVSYSLLNWGGIIEDNGGVMTSVTSGTLTIPSGGTFVANTVRTYAAVTVNGTMTHSKNDSTAPYKINLTTTGNLAVGSSGTVDVSGHGYTSANGSGAGQDGGDWGSGAGHGGAGGVSSDPGSISGSPYGSETAPVTVGSGGGNNATYLGGTGGGAVRFTVGGDMSMLGSIDASAANDAENDSGGGSGGSIYLSITGAMSGAGALVADGGDGEELNAGAGGGGRISVVCSDGSGWTENYSVDPGSVGNAGSTGTYIEDCAEQASGGGGGGSGGSEITANVDNDAPQVLTGTEKICDNSGGIADSDAAITACSNVSSVDLVAGSTVALSFFVQVRDANGEADIASSGHTGAYYHSANASPSSGACSSDNNNCYQLSGVKSGVINSTDAWIRYNFTLQYYTDDSDGAANWVAYASVIDNGAASDDNGGDEYTNEVNSLVSMTFPDVVFGGIDLPFTSSDANNVEINHQNNGNVLVDANINLNGGAMTCTSGSIDATSVKFDPASDVAFGSMTKTLTGSPTNVEMDIEVAQRTNDAAPQTGVDVKTSYWGLSVISGIAGSCTGTLNVTAFEGP